MKLKAMALAAALALGSAVAQADPVLIDNFNDPFTSPGQAVKSDVVDTTATSSLGGLSGVLGGARELSVTCREGCTAGSFTDFAALSVQSGRLAWVNGSGVRSNALVYWDGSAEGAGSLNFNMLAAGSSIVASIIEADLGFNYILTLGTSGGGKTSLFSGTVNAVLNDGTPEDAFYALSWFTLADGFYFLDGLPFTISNYDGPGVNLADVDYISLELSNVGTCVADPESKKCSTAVDLRVDDARLVPEPGSVALAGLGLLGLAALRRRKSA